MVYSHTWYTVTNDIQRKQQTKDMAQESLNRQPRRKDPFHASDKEKNKAKLNFTNTTSKTTSITKTFTYYTLPIFIITTSTTTTFTFTTTTFTNTTFTWSSTSLSFSRLVCIHSSFTCFCNARFTLGNGPALLQISNAFIPKSFST